tara:strand:+ start:103 stop:429 length:327 start_codon:yes stop_codon:yes gene_type:complete
MSVKTGQLRHRVIIQTHTTTNDEFGHPGRTWSDLDTVWASVIPVSAREYQEGKQTVGEVTHRVVMRYRSGFDQADRLKFGTRLLEIVALINPLERNERLEILVKEDAA